MNLDQVVYAKDVLRAIAEVRRLGPRRAWSRLERLEPDLAEHALEELTALHHALGRTAAHPKQTRRSWRRAEALVLVLVTALRTARLRLWRDCRSSGSSSDAGREEGTPDE